MASDNKMMALTEIQSEMLSESELKELTGRSTHKTQLSWLKDNHWEFIINADNKIKVGRYYTRYRLAGINLAEAKPENHLPHFDKVS